MSYIKKNDLKDIVGVKLEGLLAPKGFSLIKNKSKLYKELKGGALILDYRILDSYDTNINEVEWKIELCFFIRLDVIHDWFKPFEIRKKSDLKYNWTFGKCMDKFSNLVTSIPVNPSNLDGQLSTLLHEVEKKIEWFWENYNSVDKLFKALLPDSILDQYNERAFNFRTAIENLTIVWLTNIEEFDFYKNVYYEKLKSLMEVGDPLTLEYLPKFNQIINSLKGYDFSGANLELKYD